jgi:hypothetical protein
MDAIILDQIPFQVDVEGLKKTLHIRPDHKMGDTLEQLVGEAQALAKPKVIYKVAFIDSKTDDGVVVDGVTFTSRVLRVNLDAVQRIFPYVVTCGMEMEEWARAIDDMLQNFWADAIKEIALRQARAFLLDHLCETYRLGQTSSMNPGSLKDWPIQQQRPLFQLLGDVEAAIGVQLTSSLLMIPNKTVSGIRFPTETTFESCQLCPNERCPNRRATYQPDLLEEKYNH